MMIADMSFRKLNAPHLMKKVAEGRKYKDVVEIETMRVAA